MRYCIYCGMPMEDDDQFCTRCGKAVGQSQGEGPQEEGADTEILYEGPAGEDAYSGDPYSVPQMDPPAGNRETARSSGLSSTGGDFENPGSASSAGTSFDYSRYEDYTDDEDERGGFFSGRADWNRYILTAAAVIVVAVLGILLFMLVRPAGKKDGEDDGSGNQVAAYDADDSAGSGQNTGQADANPVSGQETGQNPEAGAGGADVQTAGNAAGAGGQDSESHAGGNANGQTAGNGAGGSDPADPEDAQYGWVIDEDGNEVYYPAAGEQYVGNDQTEVGGDYLGGSGDSNMQNDSGEEVQQQSTEEAEREEAEQEEAGQSGLQGYSGSGTDDSYILPESASRYYTRAELEQLDSGTLQMAINEIYARHGRKFDTPEVQAYFESKSWYRGTIDPAVFDGNESSYFNEYEMGNRELMAAIRTEREAAAGAGAAGTGNGQ